MSRGGIRKGAGRPSGQGRFGEKTKPIRVPESRVVDVLNLIHSESYTIPLYSSHVSAGFPSPADDDIEESLDLNQHLIKHPAATFFLLVSGDSMEGAGIYDGDLLVVDKSLEASNQKIVIVALEGQLTVKRLVKKNDQVWLYPENTNYQPMLLTDQQDITVWGVVTNVIHKV